MSLKSRLRVVPDWVEVQVADKHIESDGHTSFAAHPGGSTLEEGRSAHEEHQSEGGKGRVVLEEGGT